MFAELMWKSCGMILQRIRESTFPRNMQPFSAGFKLFQRGRARCPKRIVVVEGVAVKKMDFLDWCLGEKIEHIGACAAEPDDGYLWDLQLLRNLADAGTAGVGIEVLERRLSSGMGMTRNVLADALGSMACAWLSIRLT